jgi:hypothetical protein
MRAELVSFRNWARFDSWFGHQAALCENRKLCITPSIMIVLSPHFYVGLC